MLIFFSIYTYFLQNLFLLTFSSQNVDYIFSYPIRAACPANLVPIHFFTIVMFDEGANYEVPSVCKFLQPVTAFFLF